MYFRLEAILARILNIVGPPCQGFFRLLSPALSSFGEERENYFVGRFTGVVRSEPDGQPHNPRLISVTPSAYLNSRPFVEFASKVFCSLRSLAAKEIRVHRCSSVVKNSLRLCVFALNGNNYLEFAFAHTRNCSIASYKTPASPRKSPEPFGSPVFTSYHSKKPLFFRTRSIIGLISV